MNNCKNKSKNDKIKIRESKKNKGIENYKELVFIYKIIQ